MNKSLITNLVAGVTFAAGSYLAHPTLQTVGLFAVSGAITNWVAVHMLFERVPGLYGSGVIPQHFEELKSAIRELMMTQFFHEQNIARFVSDAGSDTNTAIDLKPVILEMDLSPTFDGLVTTIEESSFGSMLSMIGGAAGLDSLKQPFISRMQETLLSLSESEQVQTAILSGIQSQAGTESIRDKIIHIVDQRLDELTPSLVKTMIQEIIRSHLGWLVVWGGVFGAMIGFVSSLFIA